MPSLSTNQRSVILPFIDKDGKKVVPTLSRVLKSILQGGKVYFRAEI